MARQSLLWTALPNGTSDDGKSIRLSVLLSPRLDAENDPAILETFDDFVDWPETLARTELTIQYGGSSVVVGGGETNGPNRIDASLGTATSATWRALFPPSTFVRSFKFKDLSQSHVLSYSVRRVEGLLRDLYVSLARNAGDELPAISRFFDDPLWKEVIDAVTRNDRELLIREASDRESVGLRDVAGHFDAFRTGALANRYPVEELLSTLQLYHTPPSTPEVQKYEVDDPADPKSRASWRTYKRAELPKSEDFAQRIDFHQIVAAMNQYPKLLRELGLVVDLSLAAGALAPASDQPLTVTAQLPGQPAGSPVARVGVASPATRTRLTASQFAPRPRPTAQLGDLRIRDGLLDLGASQVGLVQTDVDGAALKLMNFARSLARWQARGTLDPTTRYERTLGAPALRNAGLMLVQEARWAMLKNALVKAKTTNQAIEAAGAPPELYAEDLLRGYRIDIWDQKTGVWRSLCLRSSTYDIDGGAVQIQHQGEEGTVRLAATRSADETSNTDLVYLHETLTSWTGWSLCVPPPGRTIGIDDKPADAAAEAPPGLRLAVSFDVLPGQLPRLRYGRHYWIRARVVDLASNSLPAQERDFGGEAPAQHAVPYLRYEPIAAPVLALARPAAGSVTPPGEGESMERIAIRTFNDKFDDPAKSTQEAQRFVLPVRTSAREAELHGALDAGGRVDPVWYQTLATKDAALEQEELETAGPLSQEKTKTSFAVHEEAVPLPYLPDPLATDIAVRIFHHPTFSDQKILRAPLYPGNAEWPDAVPFKIVVLEDPNGTPEFVNGVLRIPLPKAARVRLRLSVAPSEAALELLGIWMAWLNNADRNNLHERVSAGRHWMLTPWREIDLVHAVQRPLIAPTIDKLVVSRFLGDTSAAPRFAARVSLASTDHLDLRAEWNEPTDEAETAGKNIARSDHAFSVKITEPGSYAAVTEDPSFTGVPDHTVLSSDAIGVGLASSDELPRKRHEFNDTRYRRIEYWLEATTRFREYLPTQLIAQQVGNDLEPTDEKIKVAGKKWTAWIPSSAPPPAPEVLYVVPTFEWDRQGGPQEQRSWRHGGGLRVYLDRPWCVSGYGEMLAVVLPRAGFTGEPNEEPAEQPLKKFVTQWGNDPIWKSPYVGGVAPRQVDFPRARTAPDPSGAWLPPFAQGLDEADQRPGPFPVDGLPHPSLVSWSADARVDIAPHDVAYDEVRRLWYCDIELSPRAAYYPFVRLALARYQPISAPDAHLSNIVLSDFMPLVNDRWLSVTGTDQPGVRRVAVHGRTYTDSSGHVEAENAPVSIGFGDVPLPFSAPSVSPRSVVEVWVEWLDPALGEDFGWKREPDAVVEKDGSKAAKPARLATKAIAPQETAYARDLFAKRRFDQLLKLDLIAHVAVTPPLWSGTVSLPTPSSSDRRYRLVIAEYEEYLVDGPAPYFPVPLEKGRRLVFVEHVPL